jgi:hypothetical protein
MPEESTTPVELIGGTFGATGAWQFERQIWSFGATGRHLISSLEDSRERVTNERSANRNGPDTAGVQSIKVPDRRPIAPPRHTDSKRSLEPVYQWEGVVEEIYEDGFRARLAPLGVADAHSSRPEFTEFDFEDLSDPGDLDLVGEGAVFYWTIGRSKNDAGTITNTSLVRFRRLPPPTSFQRRRAEVEASAFLSGIEVRD